MYIQHITKNDQLVLQVEYVKKTYEKDIYLKEKREREKERERERETGGEREMESYKTVYLFAQH